MVFSGMLLMLMVFLAAAHFRILFAAGSLHILSIEIIFRNQKDSQAENKRYDLK
jgi:hypothetical protein